MIKAILIDFDGTTVTHDILSILCGLAGKEKESEHLNDLFHQGKLKGITGLIQRINLLKGLSLDRIEQTVEENMHLMTGAEEFFLYLKQHSIISILHSGNILPVLKIYQKHLGISHIVGSEPVIENNILKEISEDAFPNGSFKLVGIQKILSELSIDADECLAIGDSPADIPVFNFAKYSIAINPKYDVVDHATHVISSNLELAIPIIEEINSK